MYQKSKPNQVQSRRKSSTKYRLRQQTLRPFLRAHISINKACNPINLGVKWKLLISSFLECHWIWDLDLHCLRYAGKHDRNLEIETAQNEWLLIQGVYKEMPKSIWWLITSVWKLPYVQLQLLRDCDCDIFGYCYVSLHILDNLSPNLISRDIFGKKRSRAFIWHQDCWGYRLYLWRYWLLKRAQGLLT